MKSTRNFAQASSTASIVHPALSNGRKSSSPSTKWERIPFGRLGIAGKMFQPHRSLSLKACSTNKAEQSRGCVKQAPYGTSGEGSHTCSHHLPGSPVTLRERKRLSKNVGHLVDLCEKTGGGLHGKMRCRITTRQTCGAQMCDALETLLQASSEDLPTPNAAIIPVECPVETYSNDPPLPLSTLRQDGRYMGAMVLNRVLSPHSEPDCMTSREILRVSI